MDPRASGLCAALVAAATSLTGQTWIREPTTSAPFQRLGHGLVHDPVTHRAYVFGGFAETRAVVYFGDTWSFDVASRAWTQSTAVGPSPRSDFAMAVTLTPPANIVLFGGENRAGSARIVLADTWLFDPLANAWSPVATAGPPARSGAAMVGTATQCLLWGGRSAVTDLDDTWIWDGLLHSWTQLAVVPPPARTEHGMAFDSQRNVAVMFGGRHTTPPPISLVLFADTWEFSFATNTWNQMSPANAPGPRASVAMAFHAGRGAVLLHGGEANGPYALGESWAYAAGNWTQLACAEELPALTQHAMGYDADSEAMVVFGGGTGTLVGFYGPTNATALFHADFTAFGSGCAGSAGTPRLVSTSLPRIGTTVGVRTVDLAAGSLPVLIAVGTADPIGYPLSPPFAPLCIGHVAQPDFYATTRTADGAELSVLVPANGGATIGMQVAVQAVAIDAGAIGGAAFSRPARITLR